MKEMEQEPISKEAHPCKLKKLLAVTLKVLGLELHNLLL